MLEIVVDHLRKIQNTWTFCFCLVFLALELLFQHWKTRKLPSPSGKAKLLYKQEPLSSHPNTHIQVLHTCIPSAANSRSPLVSSIFCLLSISKCKILELPQNHRSPLSEKVTPLGYSLHFLSEQEVTTSIS